MVEVDEYLALGHLCDVVHALACIVPDTRILVAEAGQDGGHDLLEIAGDFWAQGYRGSRESDETAIAGVGLVNRIGVLVAELVHDAGYPVVVLGGESVPDEALELERAALALVVELVIEGFGDVDVHGGGQLYMWGTNLHGAAGSLSHLALYALLRGQGRGRGRWSRMLVFARSRYSQQQPSEPCMRAGPARHRTPTQAPPSLPTRTRR